ncbi:hypothetical protein K438DRAFT_1778084 [Mycena galopus ATCC 62051]|nr:hypothetical protein K438DRAFT_1778084 [Mycena galopus ATCC 62051]
MSVAPKRLLTFLLSGAVSGLLTRPVSVALTLSHPVAPDTAPDTSSGRSRVSHKNFAPDTGNVGTADPASDMIHVRLKCQIYKFTSRFNRDLQQREQSASATTVFICVMGSSRLSMIPFETASNQPPNLLGLDKSYLWTRGTISDIEIDPWRKLWNLVPKIHGGPWQDLGAIVRSVTGRTEQDSSGDTPTVEACLEFKARTQAKWSKTFGRPMN